MHDKFLIHISNRFDKWIFIGGLGHERPLKVNRIRHIGRQGDTIGEKT